MNIKKTLSFFMVLTCFTASSFALNPTPGVYGGIIVGGSGQLSTEAPFFGPFHDVAINLDTPLAEKLKELEERNSNLTYTINYSLLGLIGGQLGYRWHKYRLEAQFFYNAAPYSDLVFSNGERSVTLTSNDTQNNYMAGNTYTWAYMLNAFIDLLPPDYVDSNFAPFLGIGGGYASVQNTFNFYYQGTEVPQYNLGKIQGAAAGQVIAGVLYFLDDFSNFGLDFRFFSTTNLTAQLPNNTSTYNVQFASINLTFNGAFNFG